MITKDILLVLTYLVGAGELALAIFFWVTHSKNEIRKVMALLSLSTGVWVILSGLTSYVPYSTTGYYEMAALYALGALLVTAIVHLGIVFPFPMFRFDRLHAFLIYLPVVLISYILFFSKTIVLTFNGSATWSGSITGGPLYTLYNLYLLLAYVLALVILAYRARKLDGLHRQNLTIMFWSFVLGGLPGVISYLVIPIVTGVLGYNSLVGVIPTAIWIGGTCYILLKK